MATNKMIGTGELLVSKTGRQLSPVPKINSTTNRKAKATISRIDVWLLTEATQEAMGNDYLQTILGGINIKNISPSDRDILNDILFGSE